MNEKTLAVLNPEAAQRRLIGEIVSMIEKAGFTILAAKLLTLDRRQAEKHYAVHRGKPFFEDLVDYMTSGPIFVMALEKENAVHEFRKLMGATDPAKAERSTIRGRYGEDVLRNVVHGSDSVEIAEHELKLFFSEEELTQRSQVSKE